MKSSRFALALVALVLAVSVSSARPRYFRQQTAQPAAQTAVPGPAPVEALEEVNAARAQRGLKPFLADPALGRAAAVCAQFRAERLMADHTCNDYAALEPGATARATGCAAWEPRLGFGSCAMYENWTYCGAAYCFGRDGKRYCHVFVK